MRLVMRFEIDMGSGNRFSDSPAVVSMPLLRVPATRSRVQVMELDHRQGREVADLDRSRQLYSPGALFSAVSERTIAFCKLRTYPNAVPSSSPDLILDPCHPHCVIRIFVCTMSIRSTQ